MLKTKLFDRKIEKARKEAQTKYDKKQEVVYCEYCGELLLKKDASCVYDIENKKLTFHHEKCFNKYEKHGTLQDLIESKR